MTRGTFPTPEHIARARQRGRDYASTGHVAPRPTYKNGVLQAEYEAGFRDGRRDTDRLRRECQGR